MSIDSLPRVIVWLLAAYACFYGTGHALVGRSPSVLPVAFRRVLASTIVTTVTGTALAAAGCFSLTSLIAANAAAALAGSLVRRLMLAPAAASSPAARADRLGPLIVAASLFFYWPAYPTFLGASDSTAYVATGVSLAHHGSLAREDELGPQVPANIRAILFDSMSQVFGSKGPPYRRMPGGMLIDSLDSTKVWPAFFPVPSVWAAAFVSARAPGGPDPEQAAPAYAPVFAALALWAFWLLAREWLGTWYGLLAVALLGASAPFYAAARMPLSEPIAAFFTLSGLAALAAGERSRRTPSRIAEAPDATPALGGADATPALGGPDAILAGAALGAAVFTRVEIGLMLALALALRPSFLHLPGLPGRAGAAGDHASPERRLPTSFLVSLLLVASFTIMLAMAVPGTWLLPLLDHFRNGWIRLLLTYGRPSNVQMALLAAAALVFLALGARRAGWSAMLRWSFVASVLVGQAAAASFLATRTPMWLSFSVGWSGLALAAVGGVLAWQDRARLPASALVLPLAAVVAAILFYNPHVYPALPWGARRYVPVLLPLIVLLACITASRAGSRSRLVGLACAALLAYPIAAGGRPAWGRLLAGGAYEALQQLNDAIPRDGTIFLDREISSMMPGPALWLVHDRNGITVPPTGDRLARQYVPSLVWHFTEKGPVYFVTRALGEQSRIPRVRISLVSSVPIGLLFFEQTYDRRPERLQRYMMPLAVYRMDRSLDPRGIVAR